jgi:hypothetical protein
MAKSLWPPIAQAILLILLLTLVGLLLLEGMRVPFASTVISSDPETQRVLVIANRKSPISLRVAQYYMQHRSIPTPNFLTLDLPDSSLPFESIDYLTYQKQVEQPLRDFLTHHQLSDRIRYIVLTKGIPLRVRQVPHPMIDGTTLFQNQSLDSTLAALDYKIAPIAFKDMEAKKLSGQAVFGMLTPNLYWRQTIPFEHRLTGGYLVTRLDGYSEADARSLVDHAMTPRPSLSGTVLIDPSGANESTGEPQLIDIFDPRHCTPHVIPHCTPLPRAMAEVYGREWYLDIDNDFRLSRQFIAKTVPKLSTAIAPPHTFATGQNLLAYVSWGSNDKSFRSDNYHSLQFLPGAIAETVVSTSARTFFPTWQGQSLIGDLVTAHQGVTGIRGYVDEPENRGMGSPTVLLSNYFQGANLATAYYRSIRFVGWRDVVLGDPLATARMSNGVIKELGEQHG